MDKAQKMKKATYKTQDEMFDYWLREIILFPWRVIKAIWRFICRVCSAIWNWLKSIDVVGMINLTLLVVIILLFSALIINFVRCQRCPNSVADDKVIMVEKNDSNNTEVTNRSFDKTLPVKTVKKTVAAPKAKVETVAEPVVAKEVNVAEPETPKQTLSGNTIIDAQPVRQIIYKDATIHGNLIIQNMRKYTLPCGTNVKGHLIIRNVRKLKFCGDFNVDGNVYVNRESSFGPFPKGARIKGQVIL